MRRFSRPMGRNVTALAVAAALLSLTASQSASAQPGLWAGTRGESTQPPASGPGGGPSAQQGAGTSAPESSVVTLVTGDQVRVSTLPSGGVSVNPVYPSGTAARTGSPGLVRFGWGGDSYAVPDAAVPYLGTLLDPRLFDVSYLARAQLDDKHTATVPVTVSYRGAQATTPASAPVPPGLRITRAGAASASAVLAKSHAAAFGSLLAADWRALRAGHRLAAADPLRAMARLSLAPGPGAPPLPAPPPQGVVQTGPRHGGAPPHYRTLTIKIVGLDGKPGEAIGWVQNLGDSRYGAFDVAGFGFNAQGSLTGQPGPIRVSVPDGTYSIQFSILSPHPGSFTGVDAALVAQPQVTINSDRTVTLDARTATPYQVSLTPAVSTAHRVDELMFTRSSPGGGSDTDAPFWMGLVSNSTQPWTTSQLLAAPTAPVTLGTVGFEAVTVIYPTDLAAPAPGPRYFLVFPNEGTVPAALRYRVPRASLTAVSGRLYDGVSGPTGGTRMTAPFVYTRWGLTDDLLFEPSSAGVPAGRHVDYWYSAHPALNRWQSQAETSDGYLLAGSTYRQISPGQSISESWHRAPLLPSAAAAPVSQGDGGNSPFIGPFRTFQPAVPAARQDDVALLNLQAGDADPSHYYTYPRFVASSLAFWQDGALAYSSPVAANQLTFGGIGTYPIGALLPLLGRPATYRLDWQIAPWTTSGADPVAGTDTNWTFRSGARDAAVVPRSEECGPDPARPCTFLPLLFLDYDLPLNAASRAPAGKPFTFTFTARHQQGEPAPAGVKATVSASFDDGKTWTPAAPATRLGGNRFTVTISQPALSATSGFVALRIHASDGAGNSVVQTIIRAYGLTK